MKNLIIGLLAIALVGSGIYIYMTKNGHTTESIMNTAKTINLEVDCTSIESKLLTAGVTVAVMNNSDDAYKNVEVRITAYDEAGDIVKQKNTTFLRDLEANGEFSKVVTVPAKTKSCDCVILNSEKIEE
jgi:hypothetical protein